MSNFKLALSFFIGFMACALLNGCTDGDAAERALRGAGYKDIQLTGYRWTGCSKGDDFSTGFTAKGPTGVSVSGVVCSGWFKGATIRTD